MKPWKQQPHAVAKAQPAAPFAAILEVPHPEVSLPTFFECLYGSHKADLLHRGTAYCRSCYDEKARTGKLIDQ